MAEPKPIYQLYDEWLVRHQMCKICKHQVQGPVQGPYEKYDPPKTPEIENKGKARTAFAKIIGVSDVAVHQSHYIKEYGGKRINKLIKNNKISMREAYWQSKEKMQIKRTVENLKEYIITITPIEGSQWLIHRKLKPTQIHRIKQFIQKLNVEDRK